MFLYPVQYYTVNRLFLLPYVCSNGVYPTNIYLRKRSKYAIQGAPTLAAETKARKVCTNITTYTLKKGGGENDPLLNWHRNSWGLLSVCPGYTTKRRYQQGGRKRGGGVEDREIRPITSHFSTTKQKYTGWRKRIGFPKLHKTQYAVPVTHKPVLKTTSLRKCMLSHNSPFWLFFQA